MGARLLVLLAVASAACATWNGPAAAETGPPRRFTRRAMGVAFDVAAFPPTGADEARFTAAVELAFAEVLRLERHLSSWSPDSTLSRWNAASRAAPAGPLPLDREVAELLEDALALAAETGGAFDPTVAPALRELGFYGAEPVTEPTPEARARWRERVGAARVSVEISGATASVERLAAGVEIDLSALAKGRAVERMRDVLRRAGVRNARISAGSSSVLAFGPGPGGLGWPIELPHPGEPIRWMLRDESVSTSGQTAITFGEGAAAKSHLFDPRTLAPVDHRTEMVVVRTASAQLGDGLATALVVMGVDEGRAWLARHPELARSTVVVFYAAPRDPSVDGTPEIVRVPAGAR